MSVAPGMLVLPVGHAWQGRALPVALRPGTPFWKVPAGHVVQLTPKPGWHCSKGRCQSSECSSDSKEMGDAAGGMQCQFVTGV
jgi:hypothetical protein